MLAEARSWKLRGAKAACAGVAALGLYGHAAAQVAVSAGWVDADGPRPVPVASAMSFFGGTCRQPSCAGDQWRSVLAQEGLNELRAPPGGRAYRWMWLGTNPNGPPMQVPTFGFVEIVIGSNGEASLRSSWRPAPVTLKAKRLAPFEAALAATQFSELAGQTNASCLDECQAQIMEAIVNGRYHYVARDGGISERGVRAAGVMIEALARELAAGR